jgi:hypothetical protein
VAPVADKKFYEPRDGAFLESVGLPELRLKLAKFWPTRGPRWDALAVLQTGGAVLLTEAKSYPAEMRGRGCRACHLSSKTIRASIQDAQKWFGVPSDTGWLGPLYQYANRLAHVYFLRKIGDLPAFLANLYFLDDSSLLTPTSRSSWDSRLPDFKKQLGFASTIPYSVDVFLPALPRSDLVGVA